MKLEDKKIRIVEYGNGGGFDIEINGRLFEFSDDFGYQELAGVFELLGFTDIEYREDE